MDKSDLRRQNYGLWLASVIEQGFPAMPLAKQCTYKNVKDEGYEASFYFLNICMAASKMASLIPVSW